MDLKAIIRSIPDFPQAGVLFRDITPILHNPESLRYTIDKMAELLGGTEFDLIIGPEARGFIFGTPLAYIMNKGIVPVRKAGKLPYEVYKKEYELEYGTAILEMHTDAIKKGQRVVIVDDLLATGGTSKAIIELIEEAGGEVAALVFLIELTVFEGTKVLDGYTVHSILKY